MTLSSYRLRSTFRHAIVIVAVLIATVVYPQTFGAEGLLRAVVTATGAYLPAPTESVAAGRVNKVDLDPRGRYVLISRMDTPRFAPDLGVTVPLGRVTLILYDSHTGRSRTVWEQAQPDENNPLQGSVGEIDWFADSDTALVQVSTQHVDLTNVANTRVDGESSQTLLLIHASPVMRNVTTVQQGKFWVNAPSRSSGLAFVEVSSLANDTRAEASRIFAINSRGSIWPMPEVNATMYSFRSVSDDGITAYFVRHDRGRDAAGNKIAERFLALDLKARTTAQVAAIPPAAGSLAPSTAPELTLSTGELRTQSTHAGTVTTSPAFSTKLKPLYLARADHRSEPSGFMDSLLVAPHAESARLLPDNSAVLYQSEHALYAVPLLRIPLSDYSQRVRERVLANANSIGKGMLSYTNDYDGYMPLANAHFGLFPYVKNEENIFDDPATGAPAFRYLLDGQRLSGMTDADASVAGYLDSAFGRATIYADGHVAWKDLP